MTGGTAAGGLGGTSLNGRRRERELAELAAGRPSTCWSWAVG
nr:hypothetical protein [Candidatus Frankia nodulisporulans]